MKTLTAVIERCLDDKKPVKNKWRVFKKDGKIVLAHYQHVLLIMKYDGTILHSWYETRTDKRGHDFTLNYLKNEIGKRILDPNQTGRRKLC